VRNFDYGNAGFIEGAGDVAHLLAGELVTHGVGAVAKTCIG
jgi:hypothetical protein